MHRWLLLAVCLPALASAAERVGSETCKSCHAAAYDAWRASAHAKAAEALSPAQREDPRCTHCHAPDLARALQDSYAMGREPGAAPHAEGGVTCEACHGAGQYYSPSYVMRDAELARAVGLVDPGQKSCLACHTADSPSLLPFDFASKVKLIDHWTLGAPKKDKAERKAGRASAAEPEAEPQRLAERPGL